MAWTFRLRRPGARGAAGGEALEGPDAPDALDALDDAALIARHLAGDAAVFERLYRRHATALFHTALSMTRDRMVAEELLQDAFLRAFRHLDKVRLGESASLRPWLHRILVNLVYDHWARRRFQTGSLDAGVERLAADRAPSPERRAEEDEQARVVAEALAGLPFKQRIVATLFYLQDMDVDAIADVLGVPEGTVKSRLYYGRARLREALAADVRVAFDIVPGAVGA